MPALRAFLSLFLAGAALTPQGPGPALASAGESGDPSVICDQAASYAAAETGVPVSVLKAIALTETGRSRAGVTRPWPWTVNMEGQGHWFDSFALALAFVREHHARGARSFDLGCFQINFKWHHQHFATIEAMFDPAENALYAARFLAELFSEKGNWVDAAGAYHSRLAENAERYKARFLQFSEQLSAEDAAPPRLTAPPLPPAAPQRVRINRFPLLRAGQGGQTAGSLVPLAGLPRGRSLFGDEGG